MLGPQIWIVKHLANDWLAGTWFFYYISLIMTVGSFFALIIALAVSSGPQQIFVWSTG